MTTIRFYDELLALEANDIDARSGYSVTLVAYDGNYYVYDVEGPLECCDGTGWTGNARTRCTTHFEA